MIKKATQIKAQSKNFQIVSKRKVYDLFEKSVENFPKHLNTTSVTMNDGRIRHICTVSYPRKLFTAFILSLSCTVRYGAAGVVNTRILSMRRRKKRDRWHCWRRWWIKRRRWRVWRKKNCESRSDILRNPGVWYVLSASKLIMINCIEMFR